MGGEAPSISLGSSKEDLQAEGKNQCWRYGLLCVPAALTWSCQKSLFGGDELGVRAGLPAFLGGGEMKGMSSSAGKTEVPSPGVK